MAKAGWLKRFFARFYSDEPAMLMPAVPQVHEDEDFIPDQHRKLTPQDAQKLPVDKPADDAAAADDAPVDYVPPGSAGG